MCSSDLQKEAMEYGRSSSAGEYLSGSPKNLIERKAALAVVGTMLSKTVRSQVATLINEYDSDPYYKGDDGGTESGKSRLIEAANMACKIAGEDDASELGTEFHKLWEKVNAGEEPHLVQDHLVAPLKHYKERTAPIRFLAGEALIINDELRRAGSMDHLLEIPAGAIGPDGQPLDKPWVCAGDGKTGKWEVSYPAKMSAQLAAYGLGFAYDQERNERLPLHPEMNREWGVMIHYPLAVENPRVDFYWVHLPSGLEAAKLNNRLDDMISFYRSVKGRPIKFELS